LNHHAGLTRRDFLAFSFSGTLFGWLPWRKPKQIALAGAHFQIIRKGHSKRRYLVIHGDEESARQVLMEHMETHAGIAFIIETHTRNIEIAGGQLDPNRMFSRVGAEANLKKLNPGWTQEQVEAALVILDAGRERLLHAFFPPDRGLIVALHNNGDYSVNDELDLAEQRSIKEPDNPHAFFLCTDPGDYQIMATSPYNVVLEHTVRAPDDGSLSRRAAARNVRYMNLEVKRGDAARQREMLGWAESHLP
jgi:hypothetical protein